MSVVYPLHLQREIDRRWIRRSEGTASGQQVKAAFKEVEREWLEMARLSEEGACGKNFGGDAAADLAFQEQ